MRINIFAEEFFIEAGTSTKHQIFLNSYFFNKTTSSKQTLFRIAISSEELLFGSSYFFRNQQLAASTFSGKLLLEINYFQKSYFLGSEEVVFPSFISFPQLHFPFIRWLLRGSDTSYVYWGNSLMQIYQCPHRHNLIPLFTQSNVEQSRTR